MVWSWAAITVLNFAWVTFLWRKRRENNPWLLLFFGTYAVTDASLWCMSLTADGGLGIVTYNDIGYQPWIFVVSILWLLWFQAPIWAACKLLYGRIPWWFLWPVVVYCVVLSGSETLGLSTAHRRFAMHVATEPIMLVVAMVMIGRYVLRQIHEGEPIDFLGYAVALTSMMLLLKLGLMLNAVGLLRRWQSHVFYYLYMATLIGAYFGHKRLRRWLVSH